jgi:nicotinamidase/pyrazinamidase
VARARVRPFDALVVVDMQLDFMPGGALPVPGADEIVGRVNEYVELFARAGATIVFTRDWHPPNHISFRTRGGPWPPHCVQGTPGASFHPGLRVPGDALVVSKATDPDREAYSGFEGTELDAELRRRGVRRLFVCGVATEYCVKATALDGVRLGYQVLLLADAVRGVNSPPNSVRRAIDEMLDAGVVLVEMGDLE